jgi:hypothetical protein
MTGLQGAADMTGSTSGELVALTNAMLGSLCGSSCFSRMLDPYSAYVKCISANTPGASIDFAAGFEFLCTRNPATNQYCLASMLDAATETANLVASGTGGVDACYYFSDKLGCCGRSLWDYYTSLGSSFADMNTTFDLCGLSRMPACPAVNTIRKFVNTQVHIQGADFNWFSANEQNRRAFVTALRADLASAWNVSGEYISFTDFSRGSVIGRTQVVANDDETTERAFASINSATSIPLTNLQATTATTLTASSQPATMRSVYISPGEGSTRNRAGAIAGGVVGGILALGIGVTAGIYITKRKNAGAHVR